MRLQYTHETLPDISQAVDVAPGVRWLRMPLPFSLDHVNLWLVADDGGTWSAVDTGLAVDSVKDAWRGVLKQHRLSRQIVTHFHPDHLGLAAWLEQETGAGLWITATEYATAQLVKHQIAGYSVSAMAAFFRKHGLSVERIAALEARGNAYDRGVPAIPAAFRRLFDGDRIAIGRHTWRVITGYGHSAEHASLYCESLGVLISGDMLLPRISTNVSAFAAVPEANPLRQFLDSIDRFRALPPDTLVLPSHGKPFRGLHARIEQLHAHHEERLDRLCAACKERPASAFELLPVLFEREFADAHQTMFAMGEAIAHLICLEQAGRIRRVVADGAVRFFNNH
jgi:glyoxylase-like metal-dependent hydrolase (beta-lactamase superfamily II)